MLFKEEGWEMLGERESINIKGEGCFLLFLGAFIMDLISPRGK